MGEFKINFRLQDLDKICPWGSKDALSLHWFGLTDGQLWIDVGSPTIFEYSEAARQYFACPIQYNEIGEFEAKTDTWKESHIDDEDAVFDLFYDNEYEPLVRWFYESFFAAMDNQVKMR